MIFGDAKFGLVSFLQLVDLTLHLQIRLFCKVGCRLVDWVWVYLYDICVNDISCYPRLVKTSYNKVTNNEGRLYSKEKDFLMKPWIGVFSDPFFIWKVVKICTTDIDMSLSIKFHLTFLKHFSEIFFLSQNYSEKRYFKTQGKTFRSHF